MQIVINGMLMAYEEHGTGPAVLLLHGLPADRSLLKNHIQPLKLAGYRVIVPELRGFVESSAPDIECSMDILSEKVVGLLNYLGIGRAAIVGLTLGGHVLHTLLQRYPQRLVAAVCVEPHNRKDVAAESGCLTDLISKRRVCRSLPDFLDEVKRFQPRYPILMQVA